MSKSIIFISRGTSTLALARRQLDRIEAITGDRPEDWFMTEYDEDIDDYYDHDGFDWDAFEMHLGCVADHYIDFIQEHYKDLNINL